MANFGFHIRRVDMTAAEQGRSPMGGDSDLPQDERGTDDYFAWMGRDGMEDLQQAARLLQGVPLLQDIIDAMPLPVSLLNEKGQIVLINQRWSQSMGEDADCQLGKRHGELLGCIHAVEGPEGCGTSQNCQHCGAMLSCMSSRQSQSQSVRAYHLERDTPHGVEAVELVVTSAPIVVEGRQFTIFVLQDAEAHGLDAFAPFGARS
jgi:PAS domain-containing protein